MSSELTRCEENEGVDSRDSSGPPRHHMGQPQPASRHISVHAAAFTTTVKAGEKCMSGASARSTGDANYPDAACPVALPQPAGRSGAGTTGHWLRTRSAQL